MKTDQRRFPRAEISPGMPTGAVSVLCEEARRCDERAFAHLMAHVRGTDATYRTVVMVQVENEVGILGSARDRCAMAEAAFEGAVPPELLARMHDRRNRLRPELSGALCASSGTWRDVFGAIADEAFMAWHFGRFVDAVAAAGRAEYDLPCFANAWLVQHAAEKPGEYPSGGPVSRMRDMWRVAAPHIDVLAPDIHLPDFASVCADCASGGEALLIPEARRDVHTAARAWYAFGQHDAICYAPFGLETIGQRSPEGVIFESESTSEHVALLAKSYSLLRDLLPEIGACLASGRTVGILQDNCSVRSFELGGYRVRVTFAKAHDQQSPAAGGLIASPADGEFVVAGFGFNVDFQPRTACHGIVDFLEIWEGTYVEGGWVRGRRLNGDEYGVHLGREPGVRKVRLYTYHQAPGTIGEQ